MSIVYRIAVYISVIAILSTCFPCMSSGLGYSFVREVILYAPAVSSSGYGVLSKLVLRIAYPGRGYVYFSAHPLTELDTQAAARTAALVASSIAGVDYYRYDYYVSMESSSMVVGGPSASALMAIGFLALMLNISVYNNVSMTGMVDPDGTIGPVGGLKAKLEVVASAGYKLFLIPFGERYTLVPKVSIEKYPWGIIKRVSYERIDLISYGRRLGVEVIEVASIREAFTYFTGYNITLNTSLKKPVLDDRVVGGFKKVVDRVLGNVSTLVNETKVLLDSIDQYYRSEVLKLIDSVEELVGETRDYMSKGYVVAGFYKALDSLRKAFYTYWVTKVIANRVQMDSVIREAVKETNSSILETYNLLEKLLSTSNPLLRDYELIVGLYTYYVDACRMYRDAQDYIGNGYIVKGLDTLSYSMVQSLKARLWYTVYSGLDKGSIAVGRDRVRDTSLILYSIADTTTSYAYTLARDVGGENSLLDKAMEYIGMARDCMLENNSYELIADSILAIVYSINAIHKMFIDNASVEKKLVEHISIEALYCINSINVDSILPVYYYIYARELESLGDYSKALTPLILSILYSKSITLLLSKNTYQAILKPLGKPLPHGVLGGYSNASGYNASTVNAKWFMYGLIAGVVIAVIVYTLLSMILSYRDYSRWRLRVET